MAYDSNGVKIDQQAISLWLNRFIPDLKAWTPPNTGRDALFCSGTCPANAKPDVEWAYSASPCSCRRDADIKDYKVYRTGTATVVCTVSDISWFNRGALVSVAYGLFNYRFGFCQDNTTPATSGTVTDTLRVASFSPDGLAETEGGNVQAASPSVNAADTRPVPPSGFSVTWTGAAGTSHNMKFTWSVASMSPAKGDVDANDCVVGFRVYESATGAATPLISDRLLYGHTASGVAAASPCTGTATTSFTAFDPGSAVTPLSSYAKAFVTSVDSHLNESTPVAFTIPNPPP